MTKARAPNIGQFSLDGTVYGLDEIVNQPTIIENDGLKVIHLAISEDDNAVPGFTAEALRQARKLSPEVQSRGKPPWMTAEWQAKRRMRKHGTK